MDDMIYRNDSIAEEQTSTPTAARQRINLKNGAKRFQNVQTPAAKTKKEIRQRAEKTYQGNG